MSYKSILVNLDVEGPIVPVVKAASDLAQRWNARLTGFCAADAYLPVTGPEGAELAAEVWRQMRDDDERRFKDLRKEFEALAAGVVATDWRVAQERPTYALAQAARIAVIGWISTDAASCLLISSISSSRTLASRSTPAMSRMRLRSSVANWSLLSSAVRFLCSM